MLNIKKCILTNNDCYKANRTIKPQGIMVHSTGANNPNLRRYIQPDDGVLGVNKNKNDWNRAGVQKCVHAFIGLDKNGEVQAYQTLPWNHRGWHAGGNANNTHISFEICEDDLANKDYFYKVYNKAIELCGYLCGQFNLNPDTIIDRNEGYKKGIASGHSDITHWLSKYNLTMNDFRDEVRKKMEEEMTKEQAIEKLKTIFSNEETIQFLDMYRYGDELIIKIAKNLK